MDDYDYPPQSALSVALKSRCPRCGVGKLYKGFLTVADGCSHCGQSYKSIDTGDGPAVFIILIVGFIVVGGALFVEVSYQPAYWVHAVLWGPLGILLPLILLPIMKSWLIAEQYRHKAREAQWED